MKMKLGLFMMPMHPAQRDPAQTLQEDRQAVILADRLGFHDAFVGEHLTDRCENITSGFVFLATLIAETRTIKLGTGTSNLSHSHPALIAKLLGNMVRSKRHVVYKRHEQEDDGAVPLERLLDELVICGTVNEVVDQVLALREQAGGFGELVYAGMGWVDAGLARRSMELMADEVMPRVNRAL